MSVVESGCVVSAPPGGNPDSVTSYLVLDIICNTGPAATATAVTEA